IVRRQRKEQRELASCRGRLFVQHIEESFLRAGHVELETPARLEYLAPGRLEFRLVRLAVAVFLHAQKVAQIPFGQGGCALRGRIHRAWAQNLPTKNGDDAGGEQDANQPDQLTTGVRGRSCLRRVIRRSFWMKG